MMALEQFLRVHDVFEFPYYHIEFPYNHITMSSDNKTNCKVQ